MIERKEFYFVRHGKTDYFDNDDLPLNSIGQAEALKIEPLIAKLPIRTICFSPLKRAKQTHDIISKRVKALAVEIQELSECSLEVWLKMTSGQGTRDDVVMKFLEQVKTGVNKALSQPGPILIVAHGGIHWAMCSLMDVEHQWAIDHCVPVHFTYSDQTYWKARILTGTAADERKH